jgi:hypothetical protein
MAIVRALAMAPDMGPKACYCVEIAFEDDDYELALLAKVVNDDCRQPPVTIRQGSGICEFHNRQISNRKRTIV